MSEKKKLSSYIKPLETAIAGSSDKSTIAKALESYFEGLIEFLFPESLKNERDLAEYATLKQIVVDRIHHATPLATTIIQEINQRTEELSSTAYHHLIERERKLWKQNEAKFLTLGARACVDQGIPREAVVGDGPMGRTLAGDDMLHFVAAKNHFVFDPSTFVKRLVHFGRMGENLVIELLIEHTACGRRGQMIANWGLHNEYAHLFKEVLSHVEALESEFTVPGKTQKFTALKKLVLDKSRLTMSKDGGAWMGTLVKLAQRQAFRNIGNDVTVICPIELYDKMNGNVFVGLDQLEVLTHPVTIKEQGFTSQALEKLAQEKLIFSLKAEVETWESHKIKIESLVGVKKGQYTFADMQENWLTVKEALVTVTEKLWEAYDASNSKFPELNKSVEKFLHFALINLEKEVSAQEKLIRRRLTHQLFRGFAYAWVLDTFTRGNPPGKHIENHLATGDSAVLGIKKNLPLGQGDMNPPSADEFFTGRSVMMHSTPGHHGEPLLVFLKLDTDRRDDQPMSTEETQRAIDDFKEFMKLWPYFLVGDMIPVIVIRGKQHGGVSRIGLSVIKAFGDIVNMYSQGLTDLVSAGNSHGEVVKVSSLGVLQAGIAAGSNLKDFRSKVESLADNFSDTSVQKHLTR